MKIKWKNVLLEDQELAEEILEAHFLVSYDKDGAKVKSEIEANDEDEAVIKAIDKFDIESDNITRVREVTRIPLGENNNRSRISRPYRNHSEFAQDLQAMYGEALKLTGEDKERYESARKYLSEDDVYRLAEKYGVGIRHIEMLFEDIDSILNEKTESKVNAAGNYTKPGLRKKLFKKILAGDKGGDKGEWSARKAQLLAREYKAAGGGYKD